MSSFTLKIRICSARLERQVAPSKREVIIVRYMAVRFLSDKDIKGRRAFTSRVTIIQVSKNSYRLSTRVVSPDPPIPCHYETRIVIETIRGVVENGHECGWVRDIPVEFLEKRERESELACEACGRHSTIVFPLFHLRFVVNLIKLFIRWITRQPVNC